MKCFTRSSVLARHFIALPAAVPWPNSARFSHFTFRSLARFPTKNYQLNTSFTSSPWLRSSSTNMHSGVESADLVSEIRTQSKHIEITWSDTTTSSYYSLWLRKNCHCPSCRHDNGQLLAPSFSLPAPLTVQSTQVNPQDEALHIKWNEETHETILPLQWLKENCYSRQTLQRTSQKQDVPVFKGPLKEHQYQDLLTIEDKANRYLRDLNEDGVVLVKGVPCEIGEVGKVAEIVAPVQETLYGKLFAVKSTEGAINLAYTPVALELHMDLVYYQSPPGLQLLHCIQFDEQVEGGESVFLDVVAVVQEMQRCYPDLFETLTRVPATFQKIHFDRDVPAAYSYRRPHITVNPEGKVISVIWSPPFEGPLKVPEEDVEPYYNAYRKLAEMLNTSDLKCHHRLQPGDCVVFNNMRILHARNAFVLNGGRRHLEGCYVNIDDFKNRVQVMHMKTNSGELAKRVNNGDLC